MKGPSLKPVDRQEVVEIDHDAQRVRRRRVVEDRGAARKDNVRRLTSMLWLLLMALEGLIGFRVALRLMAANPENAFASFIYTLSQLFVWPFDGLTISPGAQGIVLDIPALIAMGVYAFSGWLVIQLVWVIFYRRGTRTVETYEAE